MQIYTDFDRATKALPQTYPNRHSINTVMETTQLYHRDLCPSYMRQQVKDIIFHYENFIHHS